MLFRSQGFGYRLFASQVEYCTNLRFREQAALDQLGEHLLDLNRTIGRPDRLTILFGRRIPAQTVAGVKVQIVDHQLSTPVIRTEYRRNSVKQYVRDHTLLRTETTSYHTPDLGLNKGVEHLPQLRQAMHAVNER